jgi:hypothetical protein
MVGAALGSAIEVEQGAVIGCNFSSELVENPLLDSMASRRAILLLSFYPPKREMDTCT